jgi:hypothetical protein
LNVTGTADTGRPLVVNRLGYGVVAMLVLALIALNAVVVSRALRDDRSPAPSPQPTVAAEPPAPPPEKRPTRRKRRAKPAVPQTRGPTLAVTATRGDCWVEVRAGSEAGRVLYVGTLSTGGSLRFKRPKLWVRLGAASNVDLVVNGRPSAVPPGTVELIVPSV